MNDPTSSAKNYLAQNLTSLRQHRGWSQEYVAEAIGVTRQAVAKWEIGRSVPDVSRCDALAALYGVSLDDLLHFPSHDMGELPVPPRGKYIFGVVRLGERGQVVIPKRARDTLGLKHGDMLVVLGDSNPDTAGIALIQAEMFTGLMDMTAQTLDQIAQFTKKEDAE